MQNKKPKPDPVTITVDDLAALARLNRKTVYDLIAREKLPGVRRIGRSIRINKEIVLDWLKPR